MNHLTRAWLFGGRVRHRLKKGRSYEREDDYARLVKTYAPGKTFVDIGGMWFLSGGVAFDAEESGATGVTVVDGMDPLPDFLAERERRNSKVRFIQGDLHDRATAELVGVHDVVWCTGVLYHTPSPFLQLEHLRLMCRETLIIGTQVIPEIPGVEQGCLWYPGLSAKSRAAHATVYGPEPRLGPVHEFERAEHMGYMGWWWGITPSALRSMVELAGFDIVEELAPTPLLREIVATVSDRPSVTPPPDFARLRGLQRDGQPAPLGG
jgi:hypothetical protein